MIDELAVTPSRDVVVVEGSDAARFLQGQLSQDVATMGEAERRWSFLLHPTGKVAAWFEVLRVAPERFELEVDEGFGTEVVTRLERFKLRVDAEISLDGTRRRGDATESDRVAGAVPAMGAELTDDVIPAELGQWIIDTSVSFTKGCFTGQELVARIDSRGANTPRRLRRVEVDGPAAPGDKIEVDGEVVGALTSVAGASALAFVKRKVDPPVAAVLATTGGTCRILADAT